MVSFFDVTNRLNGNKRTISNFQLGTAKLGKFQFSIDAYFKLRYVESHSSHSIQVKKFSKSQKEILFFLEARVARLEILKIFTKISCSDLLMVWYGLVLLLFMIKSLSSRVKPELRCLHFLKVRKMTQCKP